MASRLKIVLMVVFALGVGLAAVAQVAHVLVSRLDHELIKQQLNDLVEYLKAMSKAEEVRR